MIALHFSLGGSIGVYDAVGMTSLGAVLIGTAYHRPANWRGTSRKVTPVRST